jgi:penicillin-binding protein 2
MNLGIGQGYLLTTPLQMVQMMARVANGKKKVKPTLLKAGQGLAEEQEDLDINPRYIEAVKSGLNDVVNKRGGTAYNARFDVDGASMAGKTASTQIRHISLAEREEGIKQQHELAWKDRDHAFFVAYAPVDKPRYALVVAVEHGGGGGSVAAPIASSIMRQVLELEKKDEEAKTLETQKIMSSIVPKSKPVSLQEEEDDDEPVFE